MMEATDGADRGADRTRAAGAGAHAQGAGTGRDAEGVRGEDRTGCPDALSTQEAAGAQGCAWGRPAHEQEGAHGREGERISTRTCCIRSAEARQRYDGVPPA